MALTRLIRGVYNKVLQTRHIEQKRMTTLEEKIYNHGERLIPGVTHDSMEVIRHKSSYNFFRKVIGRDLEFRVNIGESHIINIVDLGCGVGHGCLMLSTLRKSRITGIDSFPECLEYAQQHYARENIVYRIEDLNTFIPEMPEYDYIVSRGVFEHIANGLEVVGILTKWRYRLLFDVPYDEPEGANPHHVLWGIREEHFASLRDAELFFQDLSGVIYDRAQKPAKPNMIICVCSRPDLPRVSSGTITFPLPAWQPETELDQK